MANAAVAGSDDARIVFARVACDAQVRMARCGTVEEIVWLDPEDISVAGGTLVLPTIEFVDAAAAAAAAVVGCCVGGIASIWICRRVLTSSMGQLARLFTKPEAAPATNTVWMDGRRAGSAALLASGSIRRTVLP